MHISTLKPDCLVFDNNLFIVHFFFVVFCVCVRITTATENNLGSDLFILAYTDHLFSGSWINYRFSVLFWIFSLKLLWQVRSSHSFLLKRHYKDQPLFTSITMEGQATFHAFNQTWWRRDTHYFTVIIMHAFLALKIWC